MKIKLSHNVLDHGGLRQETNININLGKYTKV